jgi:carbonic anhydrase/acetyltransferase-like protein (isoleucine patch superfamily)
MKKIYLLNKDKSQVLFEYSEISELNKEFESRSITIGDHAIIENFAIIENNATIGNNATIENFARIGYNVRIGDHAIIGSSATIGDNATIGVRAKIGEDIELKFNLYMIGSAHPVTYTGNNTLSIGCMNYTIEKWLKDFENIGINAEYNKNQIEEYKQYILIAEQFAKIK